MSRVCCTIVISPVPICKLNNAHLHRTTTSNRPMLPSTAAIAVICLGTWLSPTASSGFRSLLGTDKPRCRHPCPASHFSARTSSILRVITTFSLRTSPDLPYQFCFAGRLAIRANTPECCVIDVTTATCRSRRIHPSGIGAAIFSILRRPSKVSLGFWPNLLELSIMCGLLLRPRGRVSPTYTGLTPDGRSSRLLVIGQAVQRMFDKRIVSVLSFQLTRMKASKQSVKCQMSRPRPPHFPF